MWRSRISRSSGISAFFSSVALALICCFASSEVWSQTCLQYALQGTSNWHTSLGEAQSDASQAAQTNAQNSTGGLPNLHAVGFVGTGCTSSAPFKCSYQWQVCNDSDNCSNYAVTENISTQSGSCPDCSVSG